MGYCVCAYVDWFFCAKYLFSSFIIVESITVRLWPVFPLRMASEKNPVNNGCLIGNSRKKVIDDDWKSPKFDMIIKTIIKMMMMTLWVLIWSIRAVLSEFRRASAYGRSLNVWWKYDLAVIIKLRNFGISEFRLNNALIGLKSTKNSRWVKR